MNQFDMKCITILLVLIFSFPCQRSIASIVGGTVHMDVTNCTTAVRRGPPAGRQVCNRDAPLTRLQAGRPVYRQVDMSCTQKNRSEKHYRLSTYCLKKLIPAKHSVRYYIYKNYLNKYKDDQRKRLQTFCDSFTK